MNPVRFLQKEDLPVIARLERACFSRPWSETALFSLCTEENQFGLVWENDGQPAAYLGAVFTGEEAEIANLAVFPDFRRKGAATALLKALFGVLQEKGIKAVFLEVRVSNAAAIRLYEKCGFHRIGTRKSFYSLPREDALLFRKDLP